MFLKGKFKGKNGKNSSAYSEFWTKLNFPFNSSNITTVFRPICPPPPKKNTFRGIALIKVKVLKFYFSRHVLET